MSNPTITRSFTAPREIVFRAWADVTFDELSKVVA